MNYLTEFYNTIIEALFPLSAAEKELFRLTPEEALRILPSAPEVPIPNACSVFAYKDERVAKLVWNIKYKKSSAAAKIAAFALYWHFQTKIFESGQDGIVIVPMPITDKRRRERGYNQCEILADKILELDTVNRLTIRKDILLRIHHDSRQTLKNRTDRLSDAKGIFAVREVEPPSPEVQPARHASHGEAGGPRIIVIDDVITTGSTMKEAMDTLRRAGFENVTGLSIAH